MKMKCSNCGKHNHMYRDCKMPVTSIGIIPFKIENVLDVLRNSNNKKINFEDVKLLMVRRKNSLGFIEFVRGRYSIRDIKKIKSLLIQMIPKELELIKKKNFQNIWIELWTTEKDTSHHKSEKKESINKYNFILNHYDIDKLVNDTKPLYQTAEWGFPKGRKNGYESNLNCGVREFVEETFIDEGKLNIFFEIDMISEYFMGTNEINYIHKYYTAWIDDNNVDYNINENNCHEIGDIRWLNVIDAIDIIHDRRKTKRDIIIETYNSIRNILKYYNFDIEEIDHSKLTNQYPKEIFVQLFERVNRIY